MICIGEVAAKDGDARQRCQLELTYRPFAADRTALDLSERLDRNGFRTERQDDGRARSRSNGEGLERSELERLEWNARF